MTESPEIRAAVEQLVEAVGGDDVSANIFLVHETVGSATSLGDRASIAAQSRAQEVGESLRRGEAAGVRLVCLPVDQTLVAAVKALVASLGGHIAALVIVHREYGAEVMLAVPRIASDVTRKLAHDLHCRATVNAVGPAAA